MTVESGGTSSVLLLGALIGLVGLAVLVFVGALVYLRGQGNTKRAGRDRVQPQVGVAAGEPARRTESFPAPAPEPKAQQGEVMRVLRDPATGRVQVEVQGRRYEHLREIEDAHVGRRVLWAIADLVRFTGGVATNPRAVRSALQGVAWKESAPAINPGRPSPPARVEPEPAVPSTAGLRGAVSAFFQRGLSPVPSDPTADEPGSFIEQIDVILQRKMLEMDVPPSYELHVTAGPEQHLRIQVGRTFYSSIDEVPNLQAQSLIRAAVDEWEAR